MGIRGCEWVNWHDLCRGPFVLNRQEMIRVLNCVVLLEEQGRDRGIERAEGTPKGTSDGEGSSDERLAVNTSKDEQFYDERAKGSAYNGDIKNV